MHVVLGFPGLWPAASLDRAAVLAGYAAGAVAPVWRSDVGAIVLASAVVAAAALRHRRAVGAPRRARGVALGAAAGFAAVVATGAAAATAYASPRRPSAGSRGGGGDEQQADERRVECERDGDPEAHHIPHDSHQAPSQRPRFPGWPWIAVAVAFPIPGYIGWKISGPVDTVEAALIGGALTGAGLAAVQWWAAKGALGGAAAWISAGAAGYAAGLAAGAALVGYDTDLGALVLMGLVSGASLGAAQGLVLARQGNWRLGAAWGAAMPVLFALGWIAAWAIGVRVENQFTVFGAAGAVLFMLLSGLLLARFTPSSTRAVGSSTR